MSSHALYISLHFLFSQEVLKPEVVPTHLLSVLAKVLEP